VKRRLFDPGFIASVRKKLALDQREAAEIFGGESMPSRVTRMARPKPPLAAGKAAKNT